MNDHAQIMNQHQVKSHLRQCFLPNQHCEVMINQFQMVMNQSQMLNQLQNQPPMVNQPMIRQPQMMNQSTMMGRNYGQWSHTPPMNLVKSPNPMNNQIYGGIPKSGWIGRKSTDKRKDVRRKISLGYHQPPTLYELEQKNRVKARRFYHKKKINRMGPYAHAPRNTTSYIIRAKKSGGIASLVSPCPVTPTVLPTPVFSPSKEALVEMAKEEWGVDGYGSMKGLIRLRSPDHDETLDDFDEEDEDGSGEIDVEEHVEVERRLDHDLSRFEMIYPNSNSGVDCHNVLENRVDDQDTHIAHLEEENLILKDRLYLMEMDVGELRRRLLCLERQNQVVVDINEEVVENVSENDSEGFSITPLLSSRHDQEVDFVPRDEGSCNEMRHKDSRELGMNTNLVENDQKDDRVQGLGVVKKEQQECGDKEQLEVHMVDGGVKGEPVRDVCDEGAVAEEVNEHNVQLNRVNEKTRIN